MATLTITKFPAATTLNSADEFLVMQGATATKKGTIAQIASTISSAYDTVVIATAATIPASVTGFRTMGYTLAGDGGSALYKKVGSAPAHAAKIHSADGAWWEIVPEYGVIDPKQLGATANGTADDSTALVNAEAAAYTLGVALFFGPHIYTYNGNFTCRISIYSVNGTIKQISPTPGNISGIVGNNTVEITSGANLVIDGLTINSPTFRGLLVGNVTDLIVNNTHVINAVKQGIAIVSCTNGTISCCTAKYTTQPGTTFPVSGGDADGFYTQGSISITFIDCYAYDFARIGFVCEAGAIGSKDITFIRCTAELAKNCDNSTSEYNGGFWEENSENIAYIKCIAKNIDSGIGQTNGRVRGYVLSGLASIPSSNKTTLIDCALYCTGTMVYGIASKAVGPQNTLFIENFLCSNCTSGITLLGVYDSIVLKDFTLENATGTSGHMAVAQSLTATNILIDNARVLNPAWVATDGDLIYFSTAPDPSCNLTIVNTTAPFLVNLQTTLINSIIIDNCRLSFARGIHAVDVRINNSILIPLNDGGDLFGSVGITGVKATITNTRIYASSAAMAVTIHGANITTIFDNVTFDGITVIPQLTGTSNVTYNSCLFLRYGPTRSFAITANTATATRYEMAVRNCKFVGDAVGHTPIDDQGFSQPTYSIIQNNSYNTTLLISATWTTGLTNSNNVQTL